MNKKQFDYIENKIKEAAENSSYPFDEQAWDKMETLLDKKANKKRRFFAGWWLALSLVVFTGVYLIKNNTGKEKTIANLEKIITSVENNQNNKVVNSIIKTEAKKITVQNNTDKFYVDNTKNSIDNRVKSNHRFTIKQRAAVHIKTTTPETNTGVEENNTLPDIAKNADKLSTDNNLPGIDNYSITAKKDTGIINNSNKIIPVATIDDKKTKLPDDSTKEKAIVKNPSNHYTGFYLLVSIGADAASTTFFSFANSSVTPIYGVSAGLQLNKKISIQTGFYASHKIYTAGPGEYTAEYGSYLSQVNITKVDANCLVYEIPLTVRYNFIQNKKITYYAASSVSSFIMKNEAYNYYFIYNNIPSQESKTYTGNKNLFSVLGLSLGLEKPLTNKLSILAEPSISIPLTGIGEGSVKLYSATLLFGLKYTFSKK